MKIALLTTLCLSFISLSSWAGGSGFVGNGGLGVEINGQLYLRDLFSAGLQTSASFGAEADAKLPPLPASLSFDYPQLLLQRKLTDINRAAPGLGDEILRVMKMYQWQLEEYPLTPIQDPNDPTELPAGAKLVPIANRLQMLIRVHQSSWQRLDDANKVALLIHEAIYSLVRPVRSATDTYQPALTARQITAMLFAPGLSTAEPNVFYDSLIAELTIPNTPMAPKELREAPAWSIEIAGTCLSCGAKARSNETFTANIPKMHNANDVEAFVEQVCEHVAHAAHSHPALSYTLQDHMRLPLLESSVASYSAANGVIQNYVTLDLVSENDKISISSTFEKLASCREIFADHASWLARALF